MATDKHQFALYIERALTGNDAVIISDAQLVHRITTVLRLSIGESLTLFNATHHGCAELAHVGKKEVRLHVSSVQKNSTLIPHITVILPLLRKTALHEAVYACTEIGANEVHLAITEKVQQKWTVHDMQKLHKISVAAAEQSKNFSVPTIYQPQPLQTLLRELPSAATRIFFDAVGQSVERTLADTKAHKNGTLILLFGPEGDLSLSEKEELLHHQFLFTKLTPTILRAQQAVTVGLGLFRSLHVF